ncbi:MAG TPA: Rap1a/Tai family immunity protein [Burkholderiales bacterium]|nr:Rap1a/Tai family immunity protein [Burkholderiales bacterium]
MLRPPRSVLALALAALGSVAGLPAAAQGWKYDGRELAQFAADYEKLRDSNASTDDPSLAARVAYFTGFVMGVTRANADRGWYCLPDDILAGQAWDAVAKFLRDYPDLLDGNPSTIVNGALAKSYPCTESARAAKKEEAKPRPKSTPKGTPKPAS